MAGAPIELRADPPLAHWGSLVALGPIDESSERFRKELGLPTDGPIVMTGHQPTFWHPGILAKYLAADALADTLGARAVWFVVDQDALDPFSIDIPLRPESGALETHTLRLADEPGEGISAASLSPVTPHAIDSSLAFALDGIGERARSLGAALESHRDETSAARQVVRANFEALAHVLPEHPIVYASDLCRTSLFGNLLDEMARDPAKTVRAYNEAVRRFPDAQLAELALDDTQEIYELPLWSLGAGAPRRRVYCHDLESIDRNALAPRALLATAIVRLGGCELFVHGSGGTIYDRATEHWMKDWLSASLAPSVSISADVRLGLESSSVSFKEARRARWLAHSARHNPALLGNHTAQAAKNALLEQIADAQARGKNPAALFHELHENRITFEFSHAKELADLRKNAASLGRRAAESSTALRRDWPAAIYAPEQLAALKAQVCRELSDEAKPSGAPASTNRTQAK